MKLGFISIFCYRKLPNIYLLQGKCQTAKSCIKTTVTLWKLKQKARKTNVFQSSNINIQHSGFKSILKTLICYEIKDHCWKEATWGLVLPFLHGATSRKSFPVVQAHPTLPLFYSQASQARVGMAPAAGRPHWVYFQVRVAHVHTTVFS